MPDFFANDISSRFGPEGWMQDNDRGLALAADGDWGEACEAFAAAADALARSLPSTRGHHEPLALILSNLAQANFRVGRLDEALQHAQRVCALRVAIAGEDAMPVARARMDLAVLLASRGRVDEARTLVQRAIYAVEHHVGEDDARLAIVLENAARIALVAGSPANAEPLLIRLHALLDAHDMSTTRAEQLLARVATARSRQQRHAAAERPVATVALETPETQSAFEGDLESRVYAHASIEAHDEWDDQPLRDAVAVTDVLLRTTPCGVPLIPVSTPIEPPSAHCRRDGRPRRHSGPLRRLRQLLVRPRRQVRRPRTIQCRCRWPHRSRGHSTPWICRWRHRFRFVPKRIPSTSPWSTAA
ncbi:tetratricopeptide repeat protein [Gemmatimonas sp.]|uniref:tetratricopeptide repeat protein n=1 Tax=Gemmatimonas sp. TaxID=1962908 RepID=UPI003DA27BDE